MSGVLCPECVGGEHKQCRLWVTTTAGKTPCECPECAEACPTCMGTGEVEKTVGIRWMDVPCVDCLGSGVVGRV